MNRALVAHTTLGDHWWAISLDGVEALSALYEFRVGLKSNDPNIDCQALIGESCVIELEAHHGVVRRFSGQMVRVTAMGKRGEHWYYEAIIAPKLWHASRRSDFKIWQNMTVQSIADEVLGKNAIRYEWRLKNAYKVWEYLVQYNETDLAFINRLLEHEGIYYWFEHAEDGETLILGDHFSTHEPFGGYERTPYYPPDQARADEDHYFGWQAAREPEPGRFTHKDYDFKHPSKDLTTEFSDPRGHLFDQYEIYAYPGNYVETGDGTAYANARLEALQQQQDLILLEGRVRGATPGYRFELFNHPREDQNRELLITKATYKITNNAYEGAGQSEGTHYQVRIEAIPAERQYRPPLRTPKPRTRGPETALVVGPGEIHTDEYGRVKVHFHWDRYGQKDGNDSCWVRVAHPWAGSNFGGIHIPRVGQEVIVDFEHGDPDRPIIVGRVYNGEQMPPWGLPANKTQSGFLTRSSEGAGPDNANAIRFEDAKGVEQLWIHAERNQDIEVEVDETHWVGQDRKKTIDRDETNTIHRHRTEEVDGNETITVHQNRTEEVDQNETITIHGNRSEEVDKDEKITIHQNRTEEVDQNEKITIHGNRSEEVDGSERVTIHKGRTVKVDNADKLTVGSNKTDNISGNWTVHTSKTKTETINMASMLNVGLAHMENIGLVHNSNAGLMRVEITGMNKMETVGNDRSTTIKSNDTLEVTETCKVKAKKIEITGEEEIVLSCGNSTIKLTPSLIEILSTLVKINC